MTSFPHPLDGLPVKRIFTALAMSLLPAAVLADPDHPWLRRQERALPRSVLAVVYGRDALELVSPQGVCRRPFVGYAPHLGPVKSLAADAVTPHVGRSAKQVAAAERAKAWRAANREKVKAQHQRKVQRRRIERDQLHEAAAATNRAA